jgi:hypothetical protein
MTTQRVKILKKFDAEILRHVADGFVQSLPEDMLCTWLAHFPRFDVLLQEIKEINNLRNQLEDGRARPTGCDFLVLDGGRTKGKDYGQV